MKKKKAPKFYNDKLYEKQAGASIRVESDNLIWPHTDPLNPDESPQVNFTSQTERNKEAYQGHLLYGTGLVSFRPEVSTMSHIEGSSRQAHLHTERESEQITPTPPKKNNSHLIRYTFNRRKESNRLNDPIQQLREILNLKLYTKENF